MRPRFVIPVALVLVTGAPLLASPASLEAQSVTQPRPGPRGAWRLVGHTEAQLTADHDVIVVRGPFDNFRRIKFVVTDAPLRILRMTVTFDGGGTQPIDVRQQIPQGGESRAIDLRGVGTRSIRRIDFWYETVGVLRGRADVTVFGMK
jgi:hypothetical protein